ncbi:MAG: DUF1592 domain-containing protein [Planctomycetota bacterium]|nr:DUF1592 domain-containing protein [Planctomycetota bacterium]
MIRTFFGIHFLIVCVLPTIVGGQDLRLQRQLYQNDVQPLIKKYCHDCHGADAPEGDFDLSDFQTADHVLERREDWLKALQRIRFDDMPPKDEVELADSEREKMVSLIDKLLNQIDCSRGTNPGQITIRRLNRNEYRNTIKSLIGLDYRPAADFPGDDIGYGFDNIGDVLSLPPILMEKYLTAAELISQKAIVATKYQYDLEKTTFGKDLAGDGNTTNDFEKQLFTNGTARLRIRIPTDGNYEIQYVVFGEQAGNEPVKIELIAGRKSLRTSSIRAEAPAPVTLYQKHRFEKGMRSIGIRFLNDFYDPKFKDPQRRDRNLVIKSITLKGPLKKKPNLPTTHQNIFFVTPDDQTTEQEAATKILTRLASRAYRRPATDNEINRLLKLVQLAKSNGDTFETGIQLALQAILVSPHFLFKIEQPVGKNQTRELNEYELATSLSYFIWSSMPDDTLFKLSHGKKLKDKTQLRIQVKRMLDDARSSELVKNFVGQWLQLRNLKDSSFDDAKFPEFNTRLAASMKKETELFAWDLVQRDASILEFLNADFTFVDRKLAAHYQIDQVNFSETPDDEFVRVSLKGTQRGGLLTHASVLTLTSNPTRTSPVKRGRWVLDNLLNLPPPPPAPEAMELESQTELKGTLRQRMQKHRENPQCAACHAQMDPIGFALEHFDAIGRWRENDENQPIDATGEFPSGKKFRGAKELQRLLLLEKQEQFVRCVTEKMLTFALGRGIEYYDRCAVDKIVERLQENNFRFSELIIAIAESEPFQKRKGQPK